MTRATLIRGPALVEYDSMYYYSKDDISVTVDTDSFNIDTSAYGLVDRRQKERRAEISFTPVGEWDSGIAAKILPYSATAFGASLIGATDKPLVIWCLGNDSGKKITFANAFISKLPSLTLSATKTIFGSVTFTAIGAQDTAWSGANSLYTVATGQTLPSVALSPAAILTQAYTAAWGAKSAPWNAIQTVDGWTVDFNLSVEPHETDADGILDYCMTQIEVSARARLAGITEDQVLTEMLLQGTGAARGKSLGTIGADLAITGTTFGTLTLNVACIRRAPFVFGSGANRVGEVEFVAARTLTTGAIDPLWVFS